MLQKALKSNTKNAVFVDKRNASENKKTRFGEKSNPHKNHFIGGAHSLFHNIHPQMKPRLLIVDDLPVVARGIAALLAPLFTTDTSCAQSGSEALKFVSSALHSQPYTHTIIDLELPKTSGMTYRSPH